MYVTLIFKNFTKVKFIIFAKISLGANKKNSMIEGIFPWKKMMSCFNVMQLPTLHGISLDNDHLFSDISNAPTFV